MYGIVGGVGVTAGAHRYWTHTSYSAKLPLRILMAGLYLTAGMVSRYICPCVAFQPIRLLHLNPVARVSINI
jgi:hypothetical protein